MGFRFRRTAVSQLLLILASVAQVLAQVAPPSPAPKGSMLLLHYRWQRDTLTLVSSVRVPAAVKLSRSAPERRSTGQAVTGGDPRSPFSFELLGADGKRIRTCYLRDPGLRRVEYQEKGRPGLKSQVERVDSADILLRIPEADARTIRFFRHAESSASRASSASSASWASSTASPSNPAPKGTAEHVAAQGPGAPSSKTMVAEFPLE